MPDPVITLVQVALLIAVAAIARCDGLAPPVVGDNPHIDVS
jgi:hypothetical protein